MAKFTVVKQAPETLEKGEIVITAPSFLEEIAANIRKAPARKQTGINHLREILNSIAQKYDHEMNIMKFKLVNYEGLPYQDDTELNAIILRILTTERPETLDGYLDHKIKARPMNTKMVYFTGAFTATGPFYKNGLDFVEEKDLETVLTGKPKKVVGKPAVKGNTFKIDDSGNARPATDEEVDALNAAEIVSETTHTTKY